MFIGIKRNTCLNKCFNNIVCWKNYFYFLYTLNTLYFTYKIKIKKQLIECHHIIYVIHIIDAYD